MVPTEDIVPSAPSRASWPLALGVGGLAAIWAGLWTQGMPFFTDDYDRWLAAAHGSTWPKALLALANPWGAADASWGFTERPAIVVWFKLWGGDPARYFAAKSLLFGLLVAGCVSVARRLVRSVPPALLPAALLLGSHAAIASLLWGGDLAILADLFILMAIVAFAWFLAGDHGRGWLLLPLALALLADQTKGNGRLLPVILIAGAVLAGREATRRSLGPALLCALLALPIRSLLDGDACPLLGPSLAAPFAWHQASLGQLWRFTLGGALAAPVHPFDPSLALAAELWPLGWIVLAGALVALLLKGLPTPRAPAPLPALLYGWLLVALVSTAFYPTINPFFQHRYGIDWLVPASLVLALWVDRLLTVLPWRRLGVAAVVLGSVAQLGCGASRILSLREGFAPVAQVADRLNRRVAALRQVPTRAYVNPYLQYNFWPPLPGQPLSVANPDALAHLPPGSVAYAWGPLTAPGWERLELMDGLTGAWVERLYRRPPITASLLRRVEHEALSLHEIHGRSPADRLPCQRPPGT